MPGKLGVSLSSSAVLHESLSLSMSASRIATTPVYKYIQVSVLAWVGRLGIVIITETLLAFSYSRWSEVYFCVWLSRRDWLGSIPVE